MATREFEVAERVQFVSLADLRAALLLATKELNAAGFRHEGRAIRPATLGNGLLAYYYLLSPAECLGFAKTLLKSLSIVQEASPRHEFSFLSKGDPIPESVDPNLGGRPALPGGYRKVVDDDSGGKNRMTGSDARLPKRGG